MVTKNGHVYEKSLVETYIKQNGTDPLTGETLDVADLIEIKPVDGTGGVRPRPPTLTSIPSLLGSLQSEWDAMVLELHTLRQSLHSTRQELSAALYRNDAAVRVCARLTKERDEARQALAQMASAVGTNGATAAGDQPAQGNGGTMDIDSDYAERITAKKEELRKARKNRTLPDGYATVDELRGLSAGHKSDKLAAGVHGLAADASGDLVIVAGSKGEGAVYSLSGETAVAKFKAAAVVTSAAWTGAGSFVVGLKSGAVQGFAYDAGAQTATETFSLPVHETAVVRAVLHPTGDLLVSISSDSWALVDLKGDAPKLLFAAPGGETVFASLDVHPDGELVAVGTTDGRVLVYRLPQAELVTTFESDGNDGSHKIGALAFSENGFWLASASAQVVTVWDLRRLVATKVLDLGAALKGDVSALAFDYGGRYLAAGSSSGGLSVSAYAKADKQWTQDAFTAAVPVVGVAWGPSAKSVVTVNGSGSVSVFA